MPTPQQKRTIGTISRLYRRGEPLNIAAVKRSHPELMRAVFAVKPFWGWKRALENAGVNYSKIKVALMDHIVCALCGKPFRSLPSHILRIHEVTPDEYLMDYPESDLVCEETRAELMRKYRPSIPHWEPVWSREYVLDRMAEYRRSGGNLFRSAMDKNDGPLRHAVQDYAGRLSAALRVIGVDPKKQTREAFRLKRNYPDKQAVIEGIRRRLKTGLPIYKTALLTARGSRRSDTGLLFSGINFFGSWDSALRTAGVDPAAVQEAINISQRKYKTSQEVLREIRARWRRQWPLNHGCIMAGPHPDVALSHWARRYFGSWDGALRAAGLNPLKINRSLLQKRRYPDKPSVIKAIRRRRAEGRPLNHGALVRGQDRDRCLIETAVRHFGSWDRALMAAGIDPISIRNLRRRYPDKLSVVKAIRRRRTEGRPLNCGDVCKGPYRDGRLLKTAVMYFGSWDKALMAAGINPDKIRKKSCGKKNACD